MPKSEHHSPASALLAVTLLDLANVSRTEGRLDLSHTRQPAGPLRVAKIAAFEATSGMELLFRYSRWLLVAFDVAGDLVIAGSFIADTSHR